MSDRIIRKVQELGALWEEAEEEIMTFLDERYKKVRDGIILNDNDEVPMSKKMRLFQANCGLAIIRIRMNKFTRLAENDKIKFSVVVADEGVDTIKIGFRIKSKPQKPIKICKV